MELIKVKKQVNWKRVSIGLTLLLLISIGGLVWVNATSPSNTLVLSGGKYPGAPDFTIWVEGSTYFAKNAYGNIVVDDPSFSDVMQYCNDNGGEGYSTFISSGTYVVDKQVNFDRRFYIYGAGQGADETFTLGNTILYLADSFPNGKMFYLENSTGLADSHWQIPRMSNMVIYGNMAHQTSPVTAFYQAGLIVDLQLNDIWFDSWYGSAVMLHAGGQHRIDTCWFEHQYPSHVYPWIVANGTAAGTPYFMIIQNCIFEGNAFTNVGTVAASHWNWFANEFLVWGTVNNTAIDARYTECFEFTQNFFKLCLTAFLADSTTRSLVVTDNIFGGAGGSVTTVISGSTSSSYPAVIRNNRGFENEYWGTGTLVGAAVTLSVDVPFWFASASYVTQYFICPLGANYGASWFLTAVNSTRFTVTRATGGADWSFYYYARTMPPQT